MEYKQYDYETEKTGYCCYCFPEEIRFDREEKNTSVNSVWRHEKEDHDSCCGNRWQRDFDDYKEKDCDKFDKYEEKCNGHKGREENRHAQCRQNRCCFCNLFRNFCRW